MSTLVIPKPDIVDCLIPIVGTAPLISHNWSAKAKRQMLDKQMKKATKTKDAKSPEEDYEASLYRTEDGGYGFPTVAFKAATVRAGTYAEMKMTFLRGAFHVRGELVPIVGEPEPREDMVRLQGQTADIRYRAQFPEWSAEIPVSLNRSALSVEQLVNLFTIAGFAVGVGEWRPERDGQFGTFEIGAEVQVSS